MAKKKTGAAQALSMFLFPLAMLAVMLASLATMPLLPCFLPEGASLPMDKDEVHAAAARLMAAGGALLGASVINVRFKFTGKLVTLCACGAVAYAAYHAVEVVGVIAVWVRHVQEPMAATYHLAVAAPCVLVAALHVMLRYMM